eukprot:353015-Chlamydomonas_euryale.AAC.2
MRPSRDPSYCPPRGGLLHVRALTSAEQLPAGRPTAPSRPLQGRRRRHCCCCCSPARCVSIVAVRWCGVHGRAVRRVVPGVDAVERPWRGTESLPQTGDAATRGTAHPHRRQVTQPPKAQLTRTAGG